jgi:two-component system, chemotaxis family, protein-glutamate methylesterase/glutaminase
MNPSRQPGPGFVIESWRERPVRVVIVDDSAVARQAIRTLLKDQPGIEVVGTAHDPRTAQDIIATHNADVVTLDVEMPTMDGLTFLEQLMRQRPTPVVMVSSVTEEGADVTLRALEMGAVDFVPKSSLGSGPDQQRRHAEFAGKVRAAGAARVRPLPVLDARAAVPPSPAVAARLAERIVAVGSSTGGVEALQEIICALPATSPAVLIAQHMPPHFTTRLAARLNTKAAVRVLEAEEGQLVTPGYVYIAPGDRHLRVGRWGKSYICRVSDDPPVSGHRPSCDVLFRSVARAAGAQAVGVILTGMGSDGAKGLLEMRESGAHTIGQDQATCVVYGMPKAAAALGATESEVPIDTMAARILELCS